MVSREQLVETAQAQLETYRASDVVLGQIGQVDTTLLVGYSGAGKDTLRRQTGLHVVVSDTIRPPRKNNEEMEVDGVDYWFRGEELDAVYEDLCNARYVQYGLGVNGQSFYGSRATAYPAEGAALLDVVPQQIAIISNLPFRSVEVAYITAPSFEVWMKRWAKRGLGNEDDTRARQQEAQLSLKFGLDTDGIVFIANDDQSTATAALHRFATTREIDPAEVKRGRQAASGVLRDLIAAA